MIEEKRYADFSAKMSAKARDKRLPLTATFELTRRCPLACQHCYNNLPMADGAARARELSTDEYKQLLGELAEMGCMWILLTGGEILARRDFFDIYSHARNLGLFVTLFTNATLITEAVADRLAEERPFSIEITLYGATAATYEALTQVPGSYEKCLRGIRLLKERNLPVKLKTVAVTINRHELSAMRQLAADLGVDFKFDAMINPRIDCSSSPLEVRLTAEQIVELDLNDPERLSEWRLFSERYLPTESPAPSATLYQCGGGITSFAVNPYGEMSICVLSQKQLYSLRGGSIRDGWNKFLLAVRHQAPTRPTKCGTCALKAMCGMCPANGELENNDPEKPVDFLCQVAHLRAEVFGFKVPEHGNCEFCEGGTHRASVDTAAQRLRTGTPSFDLNAVPLPQVKAQSGSCSSGGCDSCSSSHHS